MIDIQVETLCLIICGSSHPLIPFNGLHIVELFFGNNFIKI